MKKELIKNIETFLEDKKLTPCFGKVLNYNNENLLIIGNKENDIMITNTLTLYKVCDNKIIEPIGYAALRIKENKNMEIAYITIKKEFRKNGYGAILLNSCEEFGLQNDIDKITGYANLMESQTLPQFYKKSGYTFEGNDFYKSRKDFRKLKQTYSDANDNAIILN